MKYKITMCSGKVVEVEGKPATFPGLEDQEFFVGKDFFPNNSDKWYRWRVCIVGSGALLGWGQTRKSALERAQTILDRASAKMTKKEIAARFASVAEESKRLHETYVGEPLISELISRHEGKNEKAKD